MSIAELAEVKKFLADMEKNRSGKAKEYVHVKLRAEELVALADTISIPNSDDAP